MGEIRYFKEFGVKDNESEYAKKATFRPSISHPLTESPKYGIISSA